MITVLIVFLATFPSWEQIPATSPPSNALEAAVPPLVRALSDENDGIRDRAVHALGTLGPHAKAATSALVKALDDERIKWPAIDALGELGPAANLAGPALVKLLGERHTTIFARRALVKIGPDRTIGASLVKALAEGSQETQCEAAMVFVDYGRARKNEADYDVQWADDESALAEFENVAKGTIPSLVAALDKDSRVADSAMYALSWLDRLAVPALIDKLGDEQKSKGRWRAAFALAKMESDARDAIPTLENALQDEDDGLRRMAQQALARIGRPAKRDDR